MALNDVVLEKLTHDLQVGVGVYVAGSLLASQAADVLAAATPTGSTADSSPAGRGADSFPRMDAIVLTPGAPHMTSDRTVVAPRDERVALRVLPHGDRPRSVPTDNCAASSTPATGSASSARAACGCTRLTSTAGRDRLRLTDAPATATDGQAEPFFRPGALVPQAWSTCGCPLNTGS
jgi:NAD+ kinase